MTEAPKLSTTLLRVEDVLAAAQSLNEAMFMAAAAIANSEQCDAIQSVSEALRGKLDLAIGHIDKIREDLQ